MASPADTVFISYRRYLTAKLADLPKYNGLPLYQDYFAASMERLRDRFLKAPVYAALIPTPPEEHREVERAIAKVASRPQPSNEQLEAETLLERSRARADDEHEAKLLDLSR